MRKGWPPLPKGAIPARNHHVDLEVVSFEAAR